MQQDKLDAAEPISFVKGVPVIDLIYRGFIDECQNTMVISIFCVISMLIYVRNC